MSKAEKMKGYLIAFRNPENIPGVYTVFGKNLYKEIIEEAQRAGEEIIRCSKEKKT